MSKSPSNTIPEIDSRLGNANSLEANQGLTQNNNHAGSHELVELFYENHTSTNIYQSNSHESSVPQMTVPVKKTSPYKCELCNRNFKEASHFSKHKRGALCLKIARKLAKKNKLNKEVQDKKGVNLPSTFKPYQCNLCGAKFFDKVNVEFHLGRSHQTQQPLWTEVAKTSGFACSECNLWFADKVQLKHHQLQHTSQSLPINQTNDGIHNEINHHPVTHHQYFSQPLSHIAPSFSSSPIHHHQHHTYQQLAPMPPQTIYQMHQHQPPLLAQGHPNSTLTLVPQNDSIPSLSQTPGTNCYTSLSNSMSNSSAQTTVQSSTNKQPKNSKSERNVNSSIWNVCGDCGQKFVDPINVELHMQRKHPNSSILETVALSGGLTLYKTSNSSKSINAFNLESEIGNQAEKHKFFECEATSELSVHMQHSQNKISKNSNNTLEEPEGKDKKKLKTTKRNVTESASKSSSVKCDVCKKDFSSKAELIRHRVKDKNIMCGICSFSSCHNLQVAMHMYSCHKETDSNNYPDLASSKLNEFCEQVNCLSPSTQHDEIASDEASNWLSKDVSVDKDVQPSRLCCCMCNFYATSGVSLAQHLQSHGSIYVKCGKCGETSSSFVEINNHINSSHSNEVIRITMTMKASHTPSVYMFLITPKNLGSTVPNNLPTLLEKSSDNAGHDKPVSFQEVSIYACSVCGASLTGQYQLEAHLQHHQNNAGSGCRDNSLVIPSSYPSDPLCQSPLLHTQNTVEFRCQECGFWREQSESVIKHIQSVHMSAKMVHSQRQNTGRIVGQTINVFTPLSAMVSN